MKRQAVVFLAALLCVFSSGIHAQIVTEQSTVKPRELTFPTRVSQFGIFDPSIADVAAGQRLWMSYTAVDPSPRFPEQNDRIETTRLAYSDDQGKNWADYGYIINNIKELEFKGSAASWVNETSSLVYDPGAPAAERWKLFWHHYLLIEQKPRFENGWIGYKAAATPEGLKNAPEVKLFGAMAYQSQNDDANSPTKPPVAGLPVIALHKLHENLDMCAAVSEPGALATASALYLAVVCQKPNMLGLLGFHSETELLKCSAPCRASDPNAWTYVSKLLNDGFSAADLFMDKGQYYLFASPSSDDPVPGAYNGCKIYHFANIDTGTLEKDSNGQPRIIKTFAGEPHSFNGACTYRPSTPGSGIVLSQLRIGNDNKPTFHIVLSGKGL